MTRLVAVPTAWCALELDKKSIALLQRFPIDSHQRKLFAYFFAKHKSK